VTPATQVGRLGSFPDEDEGLDDILEFQVAAGSEGLEGFTEHVPRVREAREESAAVNEVELFSKGPGDFCVRDLEAAVLGDAVDLSVEC